jgi:signal transduction histidine kinase
MLFAIPPTVIFVLTLVANVAISAFVYANNPKHVTNRLFFALSGTISLWLTAMFATSIPGLAPWYLPLARSTLVLATLMNALFLLFAAAVPNDAIGISPKRLKLLAAACLAVMIVSITPLAFSGVRVVEGVPSPITGPGMALFGLFQSALNIGVIVALLRKMRGATGSRRIQLYVVFLGILLMFGTITGMIFVPVLLFGDSAYVAFAPLFVMLFTGLIGYSIFRHRLLDVKVVSAEIFSALLLLISAIQMLLATSILDFVLRLVVFLSVIIVSILLIRSVRSEVRRREEVQKLATELAASNKRLRQLDDLKTTMVSIASHQIRGPLGGIRGYLTMFRDGDLGALTDKQKEIVTLNLNVTTRLLNAVETFLDITKLESGALTLRKEVLPLDDAVKDVVDEFLLPAAKKGITLSLAFDCERPVWVEFDPEKIKHVIFNLIDNALKYTEKGSISVSVRCDGRDAIFEVTDTGMGIKPEDAPRLFGKYQRGELVLDRGGSGLGLYVVKMLTEMQGGRIWAASPGVGKGSTFGFALPISRHL